MFFIIKMSNESQHNSIIINEQVRKVNFLLNDLIKKPI